MTRNRKVLSSLAIAGVVLVAATLGCTGTKGTTEPVETPVVLRTYKVPPRLQNEVRGTLLTAMGGRSEAPVGQVSVGPGGTLVVVAPESVHEGIEQLVTELGSVESSSLEPVPVQLTYWLVVGRPAADPPGGPQPRTAASLHAIAPVLTELTRSQGPMEFSLLERLQLASLGEDSAEMTGGVATIRQRASVVGANVVADLRITAGPATIETRVKIEPGQFLVLGQSGYRDREEPEATLFYVISSNVES
jgi:hypothetical protein